jgi:hypothetical protein
LKKLRGLCVISALFAVNLLFLFSCATGPKTADPFQEEAAFLPLEPGAQAYLLAGVPACRPALDQLMARYLDHSQAREMLDRTRSLAAAFYPEGYERRFQAAAWGNYPGFRGNLALAAGKDWKKYRSKTGGAYYHSAGEGLSVALTASRAFAAGAEPGAKADPFAEEPGTEIPQGFAEFRQGAALALWINDPGSPVNNLLATMGLPLQIPAEQLFVSIFPRAGEGEGAAVKAEARYEALVRIRTPAASQARAIFSLIALAMSAASAKTADGALTLADLLFVNPPVLDGRNITFKTNAMTAEEIALLFELVSGQKTP